MATWKQIVPQDHCKKACVVLRASCFSYIVGFTLVA